MINWLHSVLHNPIHGWDPIGENYARQYGNSANADFAIVDQFAGALGGLQGKRVLDLGSGPGQYAAEFARRGAIVTCVDVSRRYLAMAESRLRAAGVEATFAVGYMDHLPRITSGGFDGVFSNVSWYYGMNDFSFAKRILGVVNIGGVVMIRETNELFDKKRSLAREIVYWLNRTVGWKIGHPHPPRGRIEAAFRRLADCEVCVDYADPIVDIVFATKTPVRRA